VTSGPPQNQYPVVNAGLDQSIELPTTSLQLSSQVSDDGLPSGGTLTFSWSQQSGPIGGTATITPGSLNLGSLDTGVTLDTTGVYVLRLTVSDGEFSSFDDVQVTLNAEVIPVNSTPVVNAGGDLTVQLPNDTLTLSSQITDDGLPSGGTLTFSWSQQSGPIGGTATITPGSLNLGSLDTGVTLDTTGVYVLRLTVSDGEFSSFDDVSLTLYDGSVVIGPVLPNSSGFWRLNEVSGNIATDASGNAQNGSLINLASSSWQPAVYGNGLCLTGQSGQQVAVSSPINFTPASVSIASWVKVDPSLSTWSWVASHGDNVGLFVNSSNKDGITFYYYNGSTWRNISFHNAGLKDGQWHHIAGTFDQSTGIMAVYKDGVLLNSAYNLDTISYIHGNDFSIGSMRGQRNFKGCLDEVQYYGRALSEQDIQLLSQVH
jgi:hypothetical protein